MVAGFVAGSAQTEAAFNTADFRRSRGFDEKIRIARKRASNRDDREAERLHLAMAMCRRRAAGSL